MMAAVIWTPNGTGSGQRQLVLFAKAYTETVDVFIGDSYYCVLGYTVPMRDKNWTTLIATNADGVENVNVAVSGAGFLNDAGKKHAYPDQVTTAIGKTQG